MRIAFVRLFPDVTVEQHLAIYCMFKGVPSGEAARPTVLSPACAAAAAVLLHAWPSRQTRNAGVPGQHKALVLLTTCVGESHAIHAKASAPVPSALPEQAAAIDTMICAVGLKEKRGVLSSQLSGGMKRKLGLAVALIGGSKVVVLDEVRAI